MEYNSGNNWVRHLKYGRDYPELFDMKSYYQINNNNYYCVNNKMQETLELKI